MLLARDVIAALAAAGQTVSVAESLTGGLLCARLTSVPGASAVVLGGVVAYDTGIKHSVLGVDEQVLRAHGAVSETTAAAMAEASRGVFDSTWAVATTGVAGPTEQEGKPVGTVFVAVSGPRQAVTGLHLSGDREGIRQQTCAVALELLHNCLE